MLQCYSSLPAEVCFGRKRTRPAYAFMFVFVFSGGHYASQQVQEWDVGEFFHWAAGTVPEEGRPAESGRPALRGEEVCQVAAPASTSRIGTSCMPARPWAKRRMPHASRSHSEGEMV